MKRIPGSLPQLVATLGTLVTLADLYATPVSVILQSPAAHDATEVRAPLAEASWATTADAQG